MAAEPRYAIKDLEPNEHELVSKVVAGLPFDLGSGAGEVTRLFTADPVLLKETYRPPWWEGKNAETQGGRRAVRAEVIEDLLRARYAELLGPRVDIKGALIVGDLNIAEAEIPTRVEFSDCVFADINLSRASFPILGMFACRLAHLEAVGLTIKHSLWMTYNRFTG